MPIFDPSSWEKVKKHLESVPLGGARQMQLRMFLKKSMAVVSDQHNVLTVYVPNRLVKDFLENNNYVDTIRAATMESLGREYRVNIDLQSNMKFGDNSNTQSKLESPFHGGRIPVPSQRNTDREGDVSKVGYSYLPQKEIQMNSSSVQPHNEVSSFDRFGLKIDDMGRGFVPHTEAKGASVSDRPSQYEKGSISSQDDSFQNMSFSKQLSLAEVKENPFYRQHKHLILKNKNFDNFVEGPTNATLCDNGKLVAEHPGTSDRNPLFVYGDTGLGKTHILFAIANSLLTNYPDKKVMYVPLISIYQDFVQAVADYSTSKNSVTGLISKFKALYKSLDVLLIDDMQEFNNKFSDSFAGEFTSIMNEISTSGKQLVFAASVHPSEIKKIDSRLSSRFRSGVVIKVEPPDSDTRRKIILKKIEEMGLKFDKQSVDFMTLKFQTNVRNLEGYIKTIGATILGPKSDTVITVDRVKSVLKDELAQRAKMVTVDNIKETVSEYFKISVKDMDSPSRSKPIARPRMIAMTLARELTGQSYPSLGKQFGDRDHSTVMHACDKLAKWIQTDHQIRSDYENLKLQLTE
ncbi:chromosomal replication initiator protein DnaA [Succinimonas amylolytica]|uniref:chromosomal replication initiator protein DnaA n=1 Tax=Succinimonas amylolytica TaxID=83769 RepID=UPI00039D1642|nr:chromosomal replication initiator protein DnaA [Succinimonas amylolytica]